ncbi:MAG: UDP-2,3-diacylglucosamine diphosphatase [Proteobacteria bacterium]|nr:UDP-2,3-diacylglucosamine diphosphatase [Burkholderiales bacterium]
MNGPEEANLIPGDPARAASAKPRYRTVWISDVHLGTKNCQAELLLRFLKSFRTDQLYLVGDIVDFWEFARSGIYWPASHNKVVRRVLKMARQGARVVFIPGNHDENLREYLPIRLGEIECVKDALHTTADGRRIWVLHGDDFDLITKYHRWLAVLGDRGYVILLWLNRVLNRIRQTFGFGYWSLSAAVKYKVKRAVNFISDFEQGLAQEARRRGVDAVLCGHIHHAEQRRIGEVLYLNCGDWVESCTAIVEHADGRLELLRFALTAEAQQRQRRAEDTDADLDDLVDGREDALA